MTRTHHLDGLRGDSAPGFFAALGLLLAAEDAGHRDARLSFDPDDWHAVLRGVEDPVEAVLAAAAAGVLPAAALALADDKVKVKVKSKDKVKSKSDGEDGGEDDEGGKGTYWPQVPPEVVRTAAKRSNDPDYAKWEKWAATASELPPPGAGTDPHKPAVGSHTSLWGGKSVTRPAGIWDAAADILTGRDGREHVVAALHGPWRYVEKSNLGLGIDDRGSTDSAAHGAGNSYGGGYAVSSSVKPSAVPAVTLLTLRALPLFPAHAGATPGFRRGRKGFRRFSWLLWEQPLSPLSVAVMVDRGERPAHDAVHPPAPDDGRRRATVPPEAFAACSSDVVVSSDQVWRFRAASTVGVR